MPTGCKRWRLRRIRRRSCLNAFCPTRWRSAWSRRGRASFLRCWRRQRRLRAGPAEVIRLRGTRAPEWRVFPPCPSLPASAARFQARYRHLRRRPDRVRAEVEEDRQAVEEAGAAEAGGKKIGLGAIVAAEIIAYT